jgi:hypothetical protein
MITDTACKNAHRSEKAKAGKPFKLADDKGLYLLVKPDVKGWAKWWRLKYSFGGNEKSLCSGTYPDVSLEQARQRRDDACLFIFDFKGFIQWFSGFNLEACECHAGTIDGNLCCTRGKVNKQHTLINIKKPK